MCIDLSCYKPLKAQFNFLDAVSIARSQKMMRVFAVTLTPSCMKTTFFRFFWSIAFDSH